MKIGVFDSGYGGLTILKEIRSRLPYYDYVYLGDNARAPYGSRSFDIVYDFTLQAVNALFAMDCQLVIIACNTASAKALRTIQQINLPNIDPSRRVLGVIRPTIEIIPKLTRSGHVGLLATKGTVASHSYAMELEKTAPDMTITEMACPMWVPLVECNEAQSEGADYFVKKYITQLLKEDPKIDTIVLGCTHYPILLPKILKYTPDNIRVLAQGARVAESFEDYLLRHPEIEDKITCNSSIEYLTTENPEKFNTLASLFLEEPIKSRRITLPYRKS